MPSLDMRGQFHLGGDVHIVLACERAECNGLVDINLHTANN